MAIKKDIKYGIIEIKNQQKIIEARMDTKMQESSSASPTTPVTLPDRAPTESYVMTHGQRRCQMANKHGIKNINEYQRCAVRNSPLIICIGGPAWTQERKREALVTVGQHLHLMPPSPITTPN